MESERLSGRGKMSMGVKGDRKSLGEVVVRGMEDVEGGMFRGGRDELSGKDGLINGIRDVSGWVEGG